VKKLLLVDGNSLINRAYYATTLTNGATYGFLNMFLRAIENLQITHVAVAFDVRAKTFRHEMIQKLINSGDEFFMREGGYKAHRKGMPDDLAQQFADLKIILDAMGISQFEQPGFEADDVIGTMSTMASNQGYDVIILTGDKDCLQLISDNVQVDLTRTGVTNMDIYDLKRFNQVYGITPTQFIDVKALMGDKGDNIPGIRGVGDKTALKLIKEHGCIENTIYKDNAIAIISKQLATIKCDMDINVSFDACKFDFPLPRDVFDLFKSRNFYSFLKRPWWDDQVREKTPLQISFF
jgi:DNA polymerase-1